MESIEGKIDHLKSAPVQQHTIWRIEQALLDGHEWIQIPADRLRSVEVVALQELGYALFNQTNVGEIQIRVRDEEYEY